MLPNGLVETFDSSAMYDHISQVDAWLLNRPRGGSVDRRIRDTGSLLGTHCMSCHTQSGVWGPAGPLRYGHRIENVATQPAERITPNDEERQRHGYELQTTFEWAIRDHLLDVRHRPSTSRTILKASAKGPGIQCVDPVAV